MGDRSAIEWTDATWNPVEGCSMAAGSADPDFGGCVNCYAARAALRRPAADLARMTSSGPRWTGHVALVPHRLDQPLRWTRPRRIFVNSMSDLFHEGLAFEVIAAVFGVMAAAPRHTFQVLTKRPARALDFFKWLEAAAETMWTPSPASLAWRRSEILCSAARCNIEGHASPNTFDAFTAGAGAPWPLPNVWLGVSVETQATADVRIPELLRCPSVVRFVSYEPALDEVDFEPYLHDSNCLEVRQNLGAGYDDDVCICSEPREVHLDQIIVGGESGPGARPTYLEWVRATIDQCRLAGVPVFVKQLGAVPVYDPQPGDHGTKVRWIDGHLCYSLRHRKGGDPSEWAADLRVRMFPGDTWA